MSTTPYLSEDDAGGPAPFVVPLATGVDIIMASVTAHWDGSGAGGTFKPCLSLYSQAGQLLSRSFPSTLMEAGDSGEVTYAPFLGRGVDSGAGSDLRPYVKHTPTAVIPNGSDPTVVGTFHISMPTDPIPGDGDLSIAFGQGRVRIFDDPGVTGTGLHGVYEVGPFVFPVGDFGFTNGAIGSGFTAPAGVPYPAIVVQGFGTFGNGTLKVLGVVDPDAGDFDYRARPDWPGMYAPGDTLFEGIWNVPVRVD